MSKQNARSSVRRKQSPSKHELDPVQPSATGSTSQGSKDQSKRSCRTLGSINGYQSREERIGGMLNQLNRLKNDYLAYVEARGQRLEQQFQENQKHKQQITDEIKALEDDLLRLLNNEESKISDSSQSKQ